MEIEKYKITRMPNEESNENKDIYDPIHNSHRVESEINLAVSNYSFVKSQVCSDLKKINKTEEWDRRLHEMFDTVDRERILTCNVKKGCIVDEVDGTDIFCNIVPPLLHYTALDAAYSVCSDDNEQFMHSNINLHVLGKKMSSAKPFTCNICKKAFKRNSYLKSHELIHANDKPMSCNICDKRFTHRSSLNRHQLTHTGDRPFICDICDMRFAQNSNLKSHLLIHTNDKPFPCNICGNRFSQHSTLKRHQVTHTGDRPFTCEICGMRFAQSFNLRSHQLTHTGDRPFMCDFCDKRFSTKQYLKIHRVSHSFETNILSNV